VDGAEDADEDLAEDYDEDPDRKLRVEIQQTFCI
jgi:hypothetical protein